MDKIAIISDVHGNITVLNDIKNRNISKIFCLGDSITKCIHSDLVIDKLRKVCDVILLGNCDYSICKPSSKGKNYWTRNLIGEERAEFISTLPISFEFYMSGHLIRLFENTELINKTNTDSIPDIIGFGHIHTSCLVRYKNKTIFNPGSVGIPVEMENNMIDDKTNKFSTVSSYTIIEGYYGDTELKPISFSFVRVPYDIQKEVKDLQNSDMPNKEAIIRTLISSISNID